MFFYPVIQITGSHTNMSTNVIDEAKKKHAVKKKKVHYTKHITVLTYNPSVPTDQIKWGENKHERPDTEESTSGQKRLQRSGLATDTVQTGWQGGLRKAPVFKIQNVAWDAVQQLMRDFI